MDYILTFIIALIIAFLATPISKAISKKVGAVDDPDSSRRMHKRPMARLGGLAIIAGFISALLFNLINNNSILVLDRKMTGIIIGILIIAAMGIYDDIKNSKPKIKFIFQILAALSIVFISEIRIESITIPFTATTFNFITTPVLHYLSFIITILWIVGIINAFNFIDGLDGLAAGIATISSAAIFIVAISRPDSSLYMIAAIMAAALAGSCMGFLPYNISPAKIIMGDTGAMFIGFTLALISIEGTLKAVTSISLAVPLLVLGLPILDTTFAILRRIVARKKIHEADRGHFHHRLVDLGLSHKTSVIIMYIASAALAISGILMISKNFLSILFIIVIVSLFLIGGIRYMREMDNEEIPDIDKEKKHAIPGNVEVEKASAD
jgi:UDP-GlcNAc:undecaprenyl-phosphate GlcNAc-1-phosphate transferase